MPPADLSRVAAVEAAQPGRATIVAQMPVHVMAPKQDGRTDEFDEFHCCAKEPWTSGDPNVETVYHEGSKHIGDEEWSCPCGVNTETTLGTFVTRILS